MLLCVILRLLVKCRIGNVEDVVVVRYLVAVEEAAELSLQGFLDLDSFLIGVENPDFAYDDRYLVVAVGFQKLAAQTVLQQTILHIVIVSIGHVAEEHSALGQRTDTFFCNLVVLHITGNQCIDREGILAIAAGCFGDRSGKRVLTVVAGIDHCWSVVVHTDVSQSLVALRTDEHSSHIVCTFRSHVGTGKVVDNVLDLQIRTSAFRAALRI